MDARNVYLDEAGYTGTDLISKDQAIFALAGVSLPEDVAANLAARHFPDNKGRELRHQALYFRRKGRDQLLAFFEELGKIPNSASVVVMHKEASLVGLLIDTWMVPFAKEQGGNLYERGANIAMMNVTYITLGGLLGREGRREFLRQLQVMMRDRTVFAYETFLDSLYDVAKRAAATMPEMEEHFAGFWGLLQEFGIKYVWKLPKDLLDPADYAFLTTASHWHRIVKDPIVLVHDDSTAMSRKKEFWESVLAEDAPSAITGMDRRTVEYPLNATLRFKDSKSTLQLQLADLVAGAAAVGWGLAAGSDVKHPDYAEALKDRQLLRPFVAGGVWPTDDVTPKDMGTEGPIHLDGEDYIKKLVAGKQKEK